MLDYYRKIRDGYVRYENQEGAVISSALDHVVFCDGLAFRDPEEDGSLHPYADWRKSDRERAADLVCRLKNEELLQLLLIGEESGLTRIQYFDRVQVADLAQIGRNNNRLQREQEQQGRFGIPLRLAGAFRKEQIWPPVLWVAATFDRNDQKLWLDKSRQIFRQAGISELFGPCGQVATEPRWEQFLYTAGESVQMVTDFVRDFCETMQNPELERTSENTRISCIAGPWPGTQIYEKRAAAEQWRISGHNAGMFERPYTDSGCLQMDGTAVLVSGDIRSLREKQAYEGIIILDCAEAFGGTTDPVRNSDGGQNPVQDRNMPEMLWKALCEGADQFLHLKDSRLLQQAVEAGIEKEGARAVRKRLQHSAERVLQDLFRSGIWDNPYCMTGQAANTANSGIVQEYLHAMHAAKVILLKNRKRTLPLTEQTRQQTVVTRLKCREMQALPDQVMRWKEKCKQHPESRQVVILETGQPVCLEGIEPDADAILLNLGAERETVDEVLTGQTEPTGLLPFQIPSSAKEVEQHCADIPFDTRAYQDSEGDRYEFAYGRNWDGRMQDWRTCLYTVETWDAYDREGKPLGFGVPRFMAKSLEEGIYHKVAMIYTVTRQGTVLVTQRAANKSYPLCWEVTGGSILMGESPAEGAVRELFEETGIQAQPQQLESLYYYVDDRRHCIYHAYLYLIDREPDQITLQPGETVAWRFLKRADFYQLAQSRQFASAEGQRFSLHKKEISEKIAEKIMQR